MACSGSSSPGDRIAEEGLEAIPGVAGDPHRVRDRFYQAQQGVSIASRLFLRIEVPLVIAVEPDHVHVDSVTSLRWRVGIAVGIVRGLLNLGSRTPTACFAAEIKLPQRFHHKMPL